MRGPMVQVVAAIHEGRMVVCAAWLVDGLQVFPKKGTSVEAHFDRLACVSSPELL